MASIKEALAEIVEAEKSGNGSVIGQYLGDKRPGVASMALKAFERMKESGEEDATPLPANAAQLSAIASGNSVPQPEDVPPAADEKNAPILPNAWIEMSLDEAAAYEKAGKLVGYDPNNGIGLIKS